jgi:hypothetical protein
MEIDCVGTIWIGERPLPHPDQIVKLRKEGHVNAGRLTYNYISDVSKDTTVINLRNKFMANPEITKNEWIDQLCVYGDEFAFYDLLASELSDLFTVMPFNEYIYKIRSGPYYKIFAQFDDVFFIKTIERLTDKQIINLYMKNDRSGVFRDFVIRNFSNREMLMYYTTIINYD